MGRPQRCCAKIIFSLIPFIHVVMGWSTLSQPLASSTFCEPSSLIQRRIAVFDSRGTQRSSFPTSTRLHGVLSRSAILKHKSRNSGQTSSVPYKKGNSDRKRNQPNDGQNNVTRTFLKDAIEEAIYRQKTAMDCLELERSKLMDGVQLLRSNHQCDSNLEPKYQENEDDDVVDRDDPKTEKKERDPRIALDRVDKRRLELIEHITKLEKLRCDMVTGEYSHKRDTRDCSLSVAIAEARFRDIVGSKGKPCSILNRPKDTWKIVAERSKGEFGRPREFTGLVFYSPLGVPILVGKPKAESDGILRRVSQGSDLWFQVEDYEGSRVLLRSSLVRGTKGSKRCLQMAADLAAFYSVWGGGHYPNKSQVFDKVPVMYTDSKHVAKRGTKVGRMRKRKSLGRIMGRPSSVGKITRGLKPS